MTTLARRETCRQTRNWKFGIPSLPRRCNHLIIRYTNVDILLKPLYFLLVCLFIVIASSAAHGDAAGLFPWQSAGYRILFKSLVTSQSQPDNDIITVIITPDYMDKDHIAIGLELSNVTWWKGIQSGATVLCQAQDNQNSTVTTMIYVDFQKFGLNLWKAKRFGRHQNMYNVRDAVNAMKPGNLYTFKWTKD